MTEDHREFTRVPPRLEAMVITENYHISRCETRDISMHGVFVLTDDVLPEDTKCNITLELAGSANDVKLSLVGTVIRNNDNGMAIEFDEIDLDSFEHLQHIVLLNADDPEAVRNEFDKHVGLKKKPES